MKRQRRMFLARAAMTLLLAVCGLTTASAGVIGHSHVFVNGKWYIANDAISGDHFHEAYLGAYSGSIIIGGEAQYDEDISGTTLTMHCQIDSTDHTFALAYYKRESDQNYFQSGGSTFSWQTLDISGLTEGEHNLKVWFTYEGSDPDNNGGIHWNKNDGGFYEIFSEANLHDLAVYANGTGTYTLGGEETTYHTCKYLTFKQTANITMTQPHTPIGGDQEFQGTFDGNNLIINNLTIQQPKNNHIGLFGQVCGAVLKNIILKDCYLVGDGYIGGIAGQIRACSSITNCQVDNVSVTGDRTVGGVAGYSSDSWISDCVASGTVKSTNGQYSRNFGGIVGYFDDRSLGTKLRNNFSACSVSGPSYVGSIVGRFEVNINNLYDNFHPTTTTGGIGADNSNVGTDQIGHAEVVVQIIKDSNCTFNMELPQPTKTWNNKDLYRSGTSVSLNVFDQADKFAYYTVSSGEISNPGVKDGSHTLTGFTTDVIVTPNYVDSKTDITGQAQIADIDALTFNGQEQHPVPVVTIGNKTLVEGLDYTVSSYTSDCISAGEKSVTIAGIGIYTGSVSKTFVINPFNISAANAISVSGIDTEYGRTGSAIHPTPSNVTCAATNNATLVAGTDYTLSYSEGCIEPGNYSVTLNGNGNYTGSWTTGFEVLESHGKTVYDGTATSACVPVDGWRTNLYQKTEMIMPSSDLVDLNGKVITALKYYLSNKSAQQLGGTFQVFMKEVNQSYFQYSTDNNFLGTEGATIVYEGSLDFTQDVMTINFTSPYNYKGGNLLIGFYLLEKSGSHQNQTAFYGTSTSHIQAIESWVGNATLDKITNSGYNGNHKFLPKTTFIYETAVTLADDATNNSTTINNKNGKIETVLLDGRTLYKDGEWNTLCLPFDVDLTDENSPLYGAIAKTLTDASVSGTTVSLTFGNPESTTEPVTTLKAGTPYIIKWDADLIINSDDDWVAFADAVAGGNTFAGKLVRLGADVNVSKKVGTWLGSNDSGNRPFCGIFDGNGHTLTLALDNGNAQGYAPFSAVQGATIMNVNTTGTVRLISDKAYHASGLVGFANGVTIQSCHVSADIQFPNGTGTVHSGGIIGHALSSSFTMTNCLFDGSIGYVSGGSGTMTNVGGLVGWSDASTPNITSCLNAGSFANPSGICKIARGDGSGRGSISQCYSTTDASTNGDRYDSRGTYTTETGSALRALLGSGWQVKDNKVVPVMGMYTATITDPVFTDVTIDNTMHNFTSTDGKVKFIGYYDAFPITSANTDIYYISTGNQLQSTGTDRTLNACRAYFQFNDGNNAREIVMKFAEDETTGIHPPTISPEGERAEAFPREGLDGVWYTVDGRKLSGKPTRKGLYIFNGKKTVIK